MTKNKLFSGFASHKAASIIAALALIMTSIFVGLATQSQLSPSLASEIAGGGGVFVSRI